MHRVWVFREGRPFCWVDSKKAVWKQTEKYMVHRLKKEGAFQVRKQRTRGEQARAAVAGQGRGRGPRDKLQGRVAVTLVRPWLQSPLLMRASSEALCPFILVVLYFFTKDSKLHNPQTPQTLHRSHAEAGVWLSSQQTPPWPGDSKWVCWLCSCLVPLTTERNVST